MNGRDRITILHVLDDLETGGSERQLAAFLAQSDRRRFHHVVCALTEAGRFNEELQALGIAVHVLGVRPQWDIARAVLRLRRLAIEVDPAVLHATLFRPGLVSRIVGVLTRRPSVTTLVSMTYEPEWMLDNPRLRPWKVWVTRAIDGASSRWLGTRFVAVTESVRRSAMRQLGIAPDRIEVINRGLIGSVLDPDPETQAAAKAALGWGDAFPLIVNVGRLVPPKGQQYLIKAMREVANRFPSARLVIAGEGPLRTHLESLIRTEGLLQHVELLGDRHDVPRLLRAADIFAFPSLNEGAANALLEAMAMGRPCVVSDVASLREITNGDEFALLARMASPEDFAGKLVALVSAPDQAARLGAAAKAHARQRYSLTASASALDAMYVRLAAGRRSSQRRLATEKP